MTFLNKAAHLLTPIIVTAAIFVVSALVHPSSGIFYAAFIIGPAVYFSAGLILVVVLSKKEDNNPWFLVIGLIIGGSALVLINHTIITLGALCSNGC